MTNPSVNYPLFYWAENYGITNNLPTMYRTGWYIPTFAELLEIKNNLSAINLSLAAIYSASITLSDPSVLSGVYFSSNQNSSSVEKSWGWFLNNGVINEVNKTASYYGIAMRTFL